MYVLYGGRYTRALMVEQLLLEGDIAYELRSVDIIKHEHRSRAFLAINPAGWVPALITPEGETLYETPAINLYLADHHGLVHLAPRVEEPQRGLFLSGLFYVHDELEPVMKRYFYPHRFVMREEDTPMVKHRALEAALERFAVIEQRLSAAGPYHLGERFSLVDLAMTYWAALIENLGVLDPYPAVKHCLALVTARPKIRAKYDEQAAWSKEYAGMQERGEGVK